MGTQFHDDKTLRVLKWLEVYYPGASIIQTGHQFSRVDAMIVTHSPWEPPTLRAIYEIKTRSTMPDQHLEYSIADTKIEAIRLITEGLQTKGSLIVCFADDSLYRWPVAERGQLVTKGPVRPSKNGPIRYLPNTEREYLGQLPKAS